MSSRQPAQQIDQQQLVHLSRVLTRHHVLRAREWDHRSPLLQGRMRLHELQPGLFLRLADVRDLYDLISESELNPGLKIAVLLRGRAEVAFGHRRLQLHGGGSPSAVMVALDRAAPFRRWGHRCGYERSLTMTLSPSWLQDRLGLARASQALHNRHLDRAFWQPSPFILSALEQLFDGLESQPTPAWRLQLEGLALALLGEALASIGSPLASRHLAPVTRPSRLQRLWQLVASGEVDALTQRQLAERLGMSVSQLQRRFHDEVGESLGSYLRRRRLESARHALMHEGISVEEAAARAGYTSAANFATAFKRAFGLTPSHCAKQRGGSARPGHSE